MWQPSLPNKGKVKVTICVDENESVYFFDHYTTLNIELFVECEGEKAYLNYFEINDKFATPNSKLYLDEYINEVYMEYETNTGNAVGGVVVRYKGISVEDYFPQTGFTPDNITFPRGCIYHGVKIGAFIYPGDMLVFPVDLDKEDFEIWNCGIKFTVRLNREKIYKGYNYDYNRFDILKAEFYGELLPAEEIDHYIELKPKGA